jgi:signal transduction histidine kinase
VDAVSFLTKEDLSAGLIRVIQLRRSLQADPALGEKWLAVKRHQSELARQTFSDLLASARYGPAGEFFLHELYGARDFEQRDSEVLRVVPLFARMLPQRAIHTLALAVRLDELSEQLDAAVARELDGPLTAESYGAAFRRAGMQDGREEQMRIIGEVGRSLDKLARIAFVAPLLRMMRAPAEAAGLGHLQHFLMTGFDAFRAMNGADEFLDTVYARQRQVVARLYDGAAPARTGLSGVAAF